MCGTTESHHSHHDDNVDSASLAERHESQLPLVTYKTAKEKLFGQKNDREIQEDELPISE